MHGLLDQLFTGLSRIACYLERFLKLVCFGLFLIIIISMSTQIFFRYALDSPLRWPEEVGRYLFVCLVFFGAALALRRSEHFAIDIFGEYMPSRLSSIIFSTVRLLMVVFLCVVVVFGVEVSVINMGQLTGATRIPVGIFYLTIPLSAGFMILFILQQVVAEWLGKDNR